MILSPEGGASKQSTYKFIVSAFFMTAHPNVHLDK